MARVLHKGVLQEVVVDDYFPVSKKDGRLMGANPSGENEVWVMILEKCWAKLYGSYSAIDGTHASTQEDFQTKCSTLSQELLFSSTLQLRQRIKNSTIYSTGCCLAAS